MLRQTRSSVVSSGMWLILPLTFLLCLNGAWWGIFEIWNPDQMAFKDFFREGHPPFSPEKFDKPPLLPYINFFLSAVPREIVTLAYEVVTGTKAGKSLDFVGIGLAKFWQAMFACGCVYFVWRIVANSIDAAIAMVPAILLATSAGFIIQAHLITTDLPLVFFMLLAFWAAQRVFLRGVWLDYVAAGMLIGLTGAMKYNGMVVGIALPVFHFFRTAPKEWLRAAFDPRLVVAVILVPIGFLAGNPFVIVEFERFLRDLTYLFATSQAFIGAGGDSTAEPGVMSMLANDLVGWPLFIIGAIAAVYSTYLIVRTTNARLRATTLAAIAVTAIYGWYLHTRTGLHVRWVLPLVPFALIAASAGWSRLRATQPQAATGVLSVLVAYGLLCSAWAGSRFAVDPRFDAIDWVRSNVPSGSRIESSNYVPRWTRYAGIDVADIRMPSVSGRHRLFLEAFAGDERITSLVPEYEKETADDAAWYSIAELQRRNPDFVVISSLYYSRFMDPRLQRLYPEISEYFARLQSDQSGYSLVFDETCCRVPAWIYPGEIPFVDNRIAILERDGHLRSQVNRITDDYVR